MTILTAKKLTTTILAILLIVVLNAQAQIQDSKKVGGKAIDQTEIVTNNDPASWSTGKIERPHIHWVYNGLPLSINYQDSANTSANGTWRNVYTSPNLDPFNPDVDGNIGYTHINIDSTLAEQPINIKYMLNDTIGAHHGVIGNISARVNRYQTECLINYTDTATGQSESIEFEVPNHLYKYFMDYDTSAATPFDPLIGYDDVNNPQKLDSILDNIYDVMVMPDFEHDKEVLARFNESSPYSNQGDSITSTLEKITENGINNPFSPATITFTSENFGKSSKSTPGNTEGPTPAEDDEEARVFETAAGNVAVKYFMPSNVVTHPGAEWGNVYEMTISDTNYRPDVNLSASGLPSDVVVTRINDTTYNVAVSVKTGNQPSTYNVTVDLDAILVGNPEIPKPDFDATNYPNPFTDNTTLRYTLKEADDVNVVIYDVQGRVVREIDVDKQKAGTHEINIDGSSYAPGLYFANITSKKGGSHAVHILKL